MTEERRRVPVPDFSKSRGERPASPQGNGGQPTPAAPVECNCPRLDPADWDGIESDWSDIAFLKTSVCALMGVPIGYGTARHGLEARAKKAGATIPKGTVVRWTSSDKGSGNVTLAADLAPNATIDVIESGQTNGYTCTASFSPGNADYVVASVAWTGPSSARIVVKNQNAFADAPATTVALATKKCLTTLVASQVVKVDAIPKGGSRTLDIGAVSHAGDYLEATVNPGGEQPESNKTNNTQRSVEFSTNKSCTPQ